MDVVAIFVQAAALIVGSLAAGMLLCWLCWYLAKIIHHPAWGPPLVAIPILLVLTGHSPHGEFLRVTLAFAAIFAVPFWMEGRAWRRRFRDRAVSGGAAPISPARAISGSSAR